MYVIALAGCNLKCIPSLLQAVEVSAADDTLGKVCAAAYESLNLDSHTALQYVATSVFATVVE